MTVQKMLKLVYSLASFTRFNIKGTEGSAIKSVFSINQLLQRFISYFKFT